MSDGLVILGGFVFRDHEIPNKIPLGGTQRHKVFDLNGNVRVVDALGPSPEDKSWSGRFRGADAIARAQAIDAMRVAGAEVELSWLGLVCTVLITKFEASTEKFYEVPYSITCTVVDDPAQDGAAAFASLDSLVDGDLAAASAILAAAPTNVSAAFSGLSAAVSGAPQLQGAANSTLAPILASAQTAAATIASAVAANDPALDTASPDGQDPGAIQAWLTSAGNNAVAQSALADSYGYVERVALNLGIGGR